MLNDTQEERALGVWQDFLEDDFEIERGNRAFSREELNQQRRDVIPVAQDYLRIFQESNISLEKFKSEINSLNKSNRLWGYRGQYGQMYLDTLYETSSGAGLLYKLESVMKRSMIAPEDVREARKKIDLLAQFSESLSRYVPRSERAPRSGAVNFLLSYFWQLQEPEEWPVYHPFLARMLQDLGLWSSGGEGARDYEQFLEINEELRSLFAEETGADCSFWDIEYALYRRRSLGREDGPGGGVDLEERSRLPTEYLPPIVSVLPQLAGDDPRAEKLCEQHGLTVREALQQRLARTWTILGYEVEQWNGGSEPGPTGVARCPEFGYALMYRGMVQPPSSILGTQQQGLRQHLSEKRQRLSREPATDSVYFVVVSDEFEAEYDSEIRNLKIETEVREIVLLEAGALLTMVRQKLRTADLDTGPLGLQNLFAESGVLTDRLLREFLGV